MFLYMKNERNTKEYSNILTTSTKETYDGIDSVYCPVLKSKVYFNSIGFRHLRYKPDGTARKLVEIIYKMTLFPLAIPSIKNSVGIVDERDINFRVGRKNNSKIKKAKTFSLVAQVGAKNPVAVRVIILRVGDGKHVFYSIMKD